MGAFGYVKSPTSLLLSTRKTEAPSFNFADVETRFGTSHHLPVRGIKMGRWKATPLAGKDPLHGEKKKQLDTSGFNNLSEFVTRLSLFTTLTPVRYWKLHKVCSMHA